MQQILGWVFAPIAWSLGVPWRDAPTIGNLLGTRMVLNEFVAYSQLGPLKATLDPKSFTIATFALCGFANFSSIGIQIGGIGALAPERRHDLARLGLRRCSPAPSPTSSPPPSPACCYEHADRAPEARKADTVNQPRGGSGTPELGAPRLVSGHGGRRRDQKPLRGAAAPGDRPGLWTRRFRRNAGREAVHPAHGHPALAGLDGRGPRRKARGRLGERAARGGAVRPRPRLRGPRPGYGRLWGPGHGPARSRALHPDQCRRRHQHQLRRGRAMVIDDHINSDRREPADRRQRRSIRAAVSRHE